MSRVIIVGGGIIGMSLAFELSTRHRQVTVVEKEKIGEKASSAGAGMLPAANADTAIHPLEHLTALSNSLHAAWSLRLQALTGIDNGYRVAGSLHLANSPGEIASLYGAMDEWTTQEVQHEVLEPDRLQRDFAFLDQAFRDQAMAVWVKESAQFENQKQLEALRIACQKQGVELLEDYCVEEWRTADGRVKQLSGRSGVIDGDQFVITAGPWTEQLTEPLSLELPMQPVRGQMIGYQLPREANRCLLEGPLINVGSRYLVARSDGRVIVGSTIEEVGFDCRTNANDIEELKRWAAQLIPALDEESWEDQWAGLRPATFDGFPYIGRLPGLPNVWVAAGHFKAGLQLSTGTAVVLADELEGGQASIDLSPFSPSRVKI